MSLNKMMDEFNNQYGVEIVPINPDNVKKAANFAAAEAKEAYDETKLTPFNPEDGVKELFDVVYASLQQLRGMGVNLDAGMELLHISNMSKRVPEDALGAEINAARERYFDVEAIALGDGYYRLYSPSQNKVIKPMCYTAADVSGALPNE